MAISWTWIYMSTINSYSTTQARQPTKVYFLLRSFVPCWSQNLPPALDGWAASSCTHVDSLCSDATHFPGEGYTVGVHYVCKVGSMQRSWVRWSWCYGYLCRATYMCPPFLSFEHILCFAPAHLYTPDRVPRARKVTRTLWEKHATRIQSTADYIFKSSIPGSVGASHLPIAWFSEVWNRREEVRRCLFMEKAEFWPTMSQTCLTRMSILCFHELMSWLVNRLYVLEGMYLPSPFATSLPRTSHPPVAYKLLEDHSVIDSSRARRAPLQCKIGLGQLIRGELHKSRVPTI